MIAFMKDTLKMPKPWIAWLWLLMAINMIGPFFFWSALEAKLVFAAIMGNAMLMVGLHAKFGFARILGLGHILWLPLLPWLYLRLCDLPAGPLSSWLWAIIAINGLSLAIDTIDVIRYARGERTPTIPGQQGGELHGS